MRARSSVELVLEVARRDLDMDVAWVSRFTPEGQVFEAVAEAEPHLGPVTGSSEPLSGSYCVRVLDGRLPPVVHEARADPRTRDLAVTEQLQIGTYVGTPVAGPSGRPRGMLCCVARSGTKTVTDAHLELLESLSRLLTQLLEAEERERDGSAAEQASRQGVRDLIAGATSGSTMSMALQPIVDLRTGAWWAVEALARFQPDDWGPAHWFGQAELMGLRCELEAAAFRAALARKPELPEGMRLAVNVSPEVLVGGHVDDDLAEADVSDLLLEVTEHAAVTDYAELLAALEPHRARGLQLAVDDAGAGYASFRHIVQLRPDVLKVDSTLIRSIDTDPVCQSLVVSLVAFAAATSSVLVAEGVETVAELEMLARLGVPSAQGFLLGRPAHALPATDVPLPPGLRPVPEHPTQTPVTPAPVVTGSRDREPLTTPTRRPRGGHPSRS